MTLDSADIVIERARDEDVEALRAVDLECFGYTWTARQYAGVVVDPNSVLLVVRDGARVVGHGWLQIGDDGGYIPTIGLLEAYRARGLGGRLLDALLEAGRRRGVTSVSLEVRANAEVARRLYVSRGFRLLGVRRGLYRSPLDDGLVMRRDETPPE